MTVIGNKLRLAFEFVPVTPSWERRYAPAQSAWAGTAIWVEGRNLCSHVAPGSSAIEEYFYIPLGPLVDWLVRAFPAIEFQERAPQFATTRAMHQSAERWFENRPLAGFTEDDWLDAREDWWSHHFLRAGGEGALLPDLALVRDDEQLVLDWAAPRFFGNDAPTMRWPNGQYGLPWEEGRLVLDQISSTVARWLRDGGAVETYPWAQFDSPLRQLEPDLSSALELFAGRPLADLEAIFGVQGIEGLLSTLHLGASSRDPAASPHCQILRDLSPNVSIGVGSVLAELGNEATREQPDLLTDWRSARRIAVDATRAAETPEKAGYLAAAEIRNALNLGSATE